MPHTSRVSVVDADGEHFYVSNKTANWLEANGRAKWTAPGAMALVFEAREHRGAPSGGAIVLQLTALRNRRRRG